jgi:IS5 family transposase
MRQAYRKQLPLAANPIPHVHAQELATMSSVLDQLPELVELVHKDLVPRGISRKKGRDGMTAEQVLRAMLIKQMNGFGYLELAFHLADSQSYSTFCRLQPGVSPKKSALQSNIKRVRPQTWQAIIRLIVQRAIELEVEPGTKTRTDCTVVESNIHEPSDSSLLWDCVRVLSRLMQGARDDFGMSFNDHSRRAHRRSLGILNAKTQRDRVTLYRDLIKVTAKTVTQAERVAQQLSQASYADIMTAVKADGIATQIRHFLGLTAQVLNQTQRRVLCNETVPASEKIVSIFEPHTDIIVKDRRDTQYGHKVCLTAGASGMVLDLVVERGNPADSTLATKMAERVRTLLGGAPDQMCFDGGFSSRANVQDIKQLGVQDVAFSKHVGLAVTDMVKNVRVFKRLRRFRAGVEGIISFLKRTFGLDRCLWSGFKSFEAYAWSSVIAANLLVFARRLLTR